MPYITRTHWFIQSLEQQNETDSEMDSEPPVQNNLDKFSSEEGEFAENKDVAAGSSAESD